MSERGTRPEIPIPALESCPKWAGPSNPVLYSVVRSLLEDAYRRRHTPLFGSSGQPMIDLHRSIERVRPLLAEVPRRYLAGIQQAALRRMGGFLGGVLSSGGSLDLHETSRRLAIRNTSQEHTELYWGAVFSAAEWGVTVVRATGQSDDAADKMSRLQKALPTDLAPGFLEEQEHTPGLPVPQKRLAKPVTGGGTLCTLGSAGRRVVDDFTQGRQSRPTMEQSEARPAFRSFYLSGFLAEHDIAVLERVSWMASSPQMRSWAIRHISIADPLLEQDRLSPLRIEFGDWLARLAPLPTDNIGNVVGYDPYEIAPVWDILPDMSHSRDAYLNFEFDCWVNAFERYLGELVPDLIHDVLREMSPLLAIAVRDLPRSRTPAPSLRPVDFDLADWGGRIARAARGLISAKDVTSGLIANLPVPVRGDVAMEKRVRALVRSAEERHGGVLERLERLWSLRSD